VKHIVSAEGRMMEVCSAYFPRNSAEAPPFRELTEVINYCRKRRLAVILGFEANPKIKCGKVRASFLLAGRFWSTKDLRLYTN
jgi:hypothetical protein